MAAICAKPTCSESAVVWLVTAPEPRVAYLHPESVPAGSALCARHRDRFTVPAGWRIVTVDEPVTHGDRLPWFADGVEVAPQPAAVTATAGSLLSRAFNGPTGRRAVVAPDELEARRLARLERIEHEVEGAPQGLGDRIEEDRHDHGDADGGSDQRTDSDVGGGDDRPDDHDEEHQPEGDDRIDAYSTDELPFPPLESKATPRAAIG